MAWGSVGTHKRTDSSQHHSCHSQGRQTHRLPSSTQCWLLEQAFLLPNRTGKVNQTPVLLGSLQLRRLRVSLWWQKSNQEQMAQLSEGLPASQEGSRGSSLVPVSVPQQT